MHYKFYLLCAFSFRLMAPALFSATALFQRLTPAPCSCTKDSFSSPLAPAHPGKCLSRSCKADSDSSVIFSSLWLPNISWSITKKVITDQEGDSLLNKFYSISYGSHSYIITYLSTNGKRASLFAFKQLDAKIFKT